MTLHNTHEYTLYSAGTVVSTADSASTALAVSHFREGIILLAVTAKSGTTPTVDFDVETSDDETNWHKLEDITQINDPDVASQYNHPAHKVTNFGKFIRVNNPAAVTGSGSFTMGKSVFIGKT